MSPITIQGNRLVFDFSLASGGQYLDLPRNKSYNCLSNQSHLFMKVTRKNPVKYGVILFLWLLSTGSIAQNLTAEIDALLNKQYKPNEPGAVALVAKGGKPIYRQAFGMADMEHNVAMTPEHVFEIGSITKQITAVCILMLMEQGKLSLDDPITKFIEDYPTHGHTITVHHLLTHTSGIKSYTGMEKWGKRWREDMTPKEMIDFFKNEPMDFAPGEKWEYNNSAYFILGYIIEKVSGITYPEFLEKNIFTPLNMKSSYYGSRSRIIPNRAMGYQKSKEFQNAEYLSHTQPFAAGSIMSTVDDLFTWHQAVQANKLVKKESIQKAFTNYKLNNGKPIHYGYGWGLNEINGSSTLEHSGGIFGYVTNGIYLPKEDVFVAVFSNCNCNPPGEVSTRVAALVIGKPYAEPVAKLKLDDAYAKSLTGVYDFEDESSRIITLEDGQFFSQRIGSGKFKIYPQDKSTFVFDTGLSSLHFATDKAGVKEVLFKNRREVVKGIKTNKPIPARTEISVSTEVMKQYAGVYEIQPGFDLTITLEDGHLMSQATGQAKVEIFPESQTKFFLKVVDAQLEFISDGDGKYNSLILYQGGRQIEGKRK
jgi:CubicO group peptidase (beta-lactamase class C family)